MPNTTVCVEKGRGMQRGVAISVASQRIDKLHTKLDSKIGICVEKFHAQRGTRGEKGWAERGVANIPAGTTNKEEGPASNTCVPFCVPVCVL